MCRNIRTLFNFEPPATEEEIRASALQFVRKLSGFTYPSKANEAAFNRTSMRFPTWREGFSARYRRLRPRATARSKPRRRASVPAHGSLRA